MIVDEAVVMPLPNTRDVEVPRQALVPFRPAAATIVTLLTCVHFSPRSAVT
jgi:hypothetical protein